MTRHWLIFTPIVMAVTLSSDVALSLDGFYGIPERKTETIGSKSESSVVDKSKRLEFHVRIERLKSETEQIYVWRSRENRPMLLRSGPEYDTYLAIDGSGFVKVSRTKKDPTGFRYVECLSLGLAVVCYHGN